MAGGQVVWCSILIERSLIEGTSEKKFQVRQKVSYVVILVQDFLSYKTPGGFAPEAGARFGS